MGEFGYTAYASGQLGEAFSLNRFLALFDSLEGTHVVADIGFVEGSSRVVEVGV